MGLIRDIEQVPSPDGHYSDVYNDLSPKYFAGFFHEIGWNEAENHINDANDGGPHYFVGFVQDVGQAE